MLGPVNGELVSVIATHFRPFSVFGFTFVFSTHNEFLDGCRYVFALN